MARVRVSVQAWRRGSPSPLEHPAPAKTGLADVVRRAGRSAASELVSALSGAAAAKRAHRDGVAAKKSFRGKGAAVYPRAVLRLHLFQPRGNAPGFVVAAARGGAVLSGSAPDGE